MKAVIILSVIVIFAVVCFSFSSQPHYIWFTEKRTSKMKNRFGFEVTGNIKLREHKTSEFPNYRNSGKCPKFEYSFNPETDSIEKFMTENVTSIITEKYGNMSFSYRNSDNQSVHVEISKPDGKENYSIALVIVDL